MAHNLQQCRVIVEKAVSAGAKGREALFLPEATDYIASSPAETIALARSTKDSDFVKGLQEEARSANLPINVGIHEPTEDGKKVKNTLIWIDGYGEIVQRYQKLHLFDVDIEGGPVLQESQSVEKGMSILAPFDTPVGRVGLTICFDLRFPEISLALKRQNCEIITFPSAFTLPTGNAHWDVLLRARAIECQSYVVAAAQVGAHNEKRTSYGHSSIISPWGEIVAQMGGVSLEPDIITANIDLDSIARVRREMPLHRRTDVYPKV
ncbi:Carbon-nitrogen hydrolase [Xylographa trunciseda]|nr:Carbon-nitrogen hydrolase [Xylographa trunciseda]